MAPIFKQQKKKKRTKVDKYINELAYVAEKDMVKP